MVGKAGQHGRDDEREVGGDGGAERNGCGGEADETSIAGVRLVDCVGVVVDELAEDLGDALRVLLCYCIANGGFKSGG